MKSMIRANARRSILRHMAAIALAGSWSVLVLGAVAAEHRSGQADLYARLSGADLVDGHPQAVGEAHIGVDAGRHRVCANIRVRGTGPVAAAHIHRGAAGEVGEIVVTLNADGFNDTLSGCAAHVAQEVLDTMTADPGGYYLGIYTLDFPSGAIRGQLEAYAPLPSPEMPPITSQVDLQAWLRGANAVPPGDPDGSGAVNLAIIYGQDRICFNISVESIEPATGANLHRGGPGEVGEVVANLDPLGFVLWTDGCVAHGDIALMDAIAANPGGYYVNVTTDDFPDGAVRGQLEDFWPTHVPSPSGEPDGVGSAGGPAFLPDAAAEVRSGSHFNAIHAGWLLMAALNLVLYAAGRRSLRRAQR